MRAKRHLEPPLGRSQAIYSLTGMAMPPVTKGPRVFEETTLQMATAWLCSVSHPCSAVVGMTEELYHTASAGVHVLAEAPPDTETVSSTGAFGSYTCRRAAQLQTASVALEGRPSGQRPSLPWGRRAASQSLIDWWACGLWCHFLAGHRPTQKSRSE